RKGPTQHPPLESSKQNLYPSITAQTILTMTKTKTLLYHITLQKNLIPLLTLPLLHTRKPNLTKKVPTPTYYKMQSKFLYIISEALMTLQNNTNGSNSATKRMLTSSA